MNQKNSSMTYVHTVKTQKAIIAQPATQKQANASITYFHTGNTQKARMPYPCTTKQKNASMAYDQTVRRRMQKVRPVHTESE